jgi:hypothetical protein
MVSFSIFNSHMSPKFRLTFHRKQRSSTPTLSSKRLTFRIPLGHTIPRCSYCSDTTILPR